MKTLALILCLLCLGLTRPPRPHVPHAKAPAAKGAQLLMVKPVAPSTNAIQSITFTGTFTGGENDTGITNGLLFAPKLAVPMAVIPPSTNPPPSVTVAWDASAGAAHYTVYSGIRSRTYTNFTNVGLALTNIVTSLAPGTNYMAATATGTNGLESDFSNEAIYVLALPLTNRVVQWWPQMATSLAGPWQDYFPDSRKSATNSTGAALYFRWSITNWTQ